VFTQKVLWPSRLPEGSSLVYAVGHISLRSTLMRFTTPAPSASTPLLKGQGRPARAPSPETDELPMSCR